MGPITLIQFYRVLFLLTPFASRISGALSETDSALLSKNYVSPINEVRDSPLERVKVKQESGFDGRVRSIRFSFKPEQDYKPNKGATRDGLYSSFNDFNFYPIRGNYNQNIGLPTRQTVSIEEASRQLPHSKSRSSATIESSRSKREIEKHLPNNEMDDLETAEAKVFRPLFVYRQQISRRLKLQNDRQSNNNRRQILSRTKPRFDRYYYPYQYYPTNPYFF
ncbi:uncharacterized protein LOC131663766 [Phymastichus coffea]|uniref:uncharacterized protein LOC131663766 n=1 Tax=Phymastichus coffea TaxID=108790 RepID=UPI00273CA1D1|nr:uncharacterized protein LOC131663766 [Phymastichus coffea]